MHWTLLIAALPAGVAVDWADRRSVIGALAS